MSVQIPPLGGDGWRQSVQYENARVYRPGPDHPVGQLALYITKGWPGEAYSVRWMRSDGSNVSGKVLTEPLVTLPTLEAAKVAAKLLLSIGADR